MKKVNFPPPRLIAFCAYFYHPRKEKEEKLRQSGDMFSKNLAFRQCQKKKDGETEREKFSQPFKR